MPMSRRDLLTGALLILVGGFAILQGIAYDIGTVRRMGPGFVPVMVGAFLVLLGIAMPVFDRKRELDAEAHAPGNPRALILISAAIAAFAVLIVPAGMVPAVFVTVFVASLADPHMRVGGALLVSTIMSALAVVVFIWGLGFQAAPFGAY